VFFPICLGWLVNFKSNQIFAATATYAAVLVVSVGGTLGIASSSNAVPLGTQVPEQC
jgi:hypothetical protein